MDKSEFIELLEKSIVAQISNAEKSYFLSKKISENADAINHAANGRYKNLFGYLQMVLQRDVILSVSKIYDNPSKKYPTLCFESLLNEMKKNADKFPVVEENGHLQQELMRSEMPREEIYELLAKKDTPAFAANKVASFFSDRLKSDEISSKIKSLKELRDKKIVHNENIEALDSPPSWDGIIDLIEVAKGFVGVTGWLLNKAYRVDGEYVLSDNSTRASFSLEGLLAELKIINKNT